MTRPYSGKQASRQQRAGGQITLFQRVVQSLEFDANLVHGLCGEQLAVVIGHYAVHGLRQASGHLAASVAAHWLMVANIVWAVARPRRVGSG